MVLSSRKGFPYKAELYGSFITRLLLDIKHPGAIFFKSTIRGLSNSIDNSSNQRTSEELWSSVLLKNIPAAGVCPFAESEDVFTSTQN